MELLIDFVSQIFAFIGNITVGVTDLSVVSEVIDTTDELKDVPFMNQDWFDYKDVMKLVVRFIFNLVCLTIIIRYIYYPIAKRKDFLFTYFMIGIVVFILCFTLENVKLELGFALGLFAIFGIIRYRTDAIEIKEMTYLFLVIGTSVMNALINKKISITEMAFANGAIIFATYGLEKLWLLRHEIYKVVLYDNIELIQSGRREELIEDLELRTGIKINRLVIRKIDLLRDTVQIRIYFFEDEQEDDYADERGQ